MLPTSDFRLAFMGFGAQQPTCHATIDVRIASTRRDTRAIAARRHEVGCLMRAGRRRVVPRRDRSMRETRRDAASWIVGC
ncbi:hypothetical protein DB32_007908 [Sandaracinus amylolyticus]|uniref:Uncharacterized protein n=1 Tax=Sandaracinus amylolyticus TaxID=927083 RepID=A0A0F6SHN6_9BACT|nr:hypothetical protein DB32_007908 [Sandaracinus amylolyticus]